MDDRLEYRRSLGLPESRQLLREQEMQRRGIERAEALLERSHAAETPAGMALARRALAPLTEAIREYVAAGMTGKPGRRATAVTLLDGIDPELAAYVAVRDCIAGAVRNYTLKGTALRIGDNLETEMMADDFEEANSALYRAVVRNARARGLTPERQAAAVKLANRHFEVVPQRWTSRDRLLVGTVLVELVIQTLGIVSAPMIIVGKKQRQEMRLTPEIEEWFHKYNETTTLLKPMYLPMVVPPQPWTTPRDTPYHGAGLRMAMLTKPFPGQMEALDAAEMPAVYAGLNAIQATPWRINRRVYEVMQEAWDKGLPLPCIPPRENEPIPEPPPEVDAAERGSRIRKGWRQYVRAIHKRNIANLSIRFEFQRALDIARENLDEPAIYFPHRLDFRGRAYPCSTTLNPQGPDEVRGLLEFAEGKEVGEDGLRWLGIHGANLFGFDKVSLNHRYLWAMEFRREAISIADDPLGNLRWTEADKPWSFLAWCFEWAEAWREELSSGEVQISRRFVSHLPIAVDGSCNGIQHFSAMLRDPVGGAAVNLTPSEKPQDIYQTVADRVMDRLRHHVDEGTEQAWMASGWLAFGIDRKITKRSVMVLPYGGTFKSCHDYTRDAVNEKIAGGAPDPFGPQNMPKAVAFLASLVWNSIGDVVIAARRAMSWLQSVARVANKAGKPLRWTTPSGFVVVQDYRDRKAGRITTRFCGNLIAYRNPEAGEKLDEPKQVSAVAPNFVHSLDASALMLTIEAGVSEDITSWAMIHDSYGTHAADTEKMGRILREQFVRLYSEHDVLAEFMYDVARQLTPEEAASLPELPECGDLDLSRVLEATYFFA